MLNYTQMFYHMGPVGMIVMAILVIFSIISWAIIFSKWFFINSMIKSNNSFLNLFWHTKDLALLINHNQNSPGLEIFKDGVMEYERQKNKGDKEDTGDKGKSR